MKEPTFAFLGAGNMAEALIRGLLRSKAVRADRIIATSRRPERLDQLCSGYGIRVSGDHADAAREADVVVLAVKPGAIGTLLAQVAPAVDARKLVVSIAAGITIAAIERRLHAGARVIRAMPNTPALVGHGACGIAQGVHVTADDLQVACMLFDAVGTTVVVEERLLDAVTGLSGSGPAYVLLMIEALADAGVENGLSHEAALHLASQTVLGAAKLLVETGMEPGVLRDQVASPGGTTLAGLKALEAGGFCAALRNAVEAAARRSRELGDKQGG